MNAQGLREIRVGLLRDLERGKLTLLDLVDAKRGLLVIQYNCGDNDEPFGPFVRHLCGEAALVRETKAERHELRLIRRAGDAERTQCRQQPVPHCTYGEADENAWATTMWFRPGSAGGFVLDAIEHICGPICIAHDRQVRFSRKKRAELAQRTCPSGR